MWGPVKKITVTMKEAGLLRLESSLPQLDKPPLLLGIISLFEEAAWIGRRYRCLSRRVVESKLRNGCRQIRILFGQIKCLSREINDCGRDGDSASGNVILGSNAF